MQANSASLGWGSPPPSASSLRDVVHVSGSLVSLSLPPHLATQILFGEVCLGHNQQLFLGFSLHVSSFPWASVRIALVPAPAMPREPGQAHCWGAQP